MLYDDIKKANMAALKAHDTETKNAYSVLLAAADYAIVNNRSQNKPFTDADMLRVVQKVLKELEEELRSYEQGNRPESVVAIKKQIEVVSQYKPQLLSEAEIKKIIETLPDKSLKSVMAKFKAEYAGKVDFGLVAKIAQTYQGK